MARSMLGAKLAPLRWVRRALVVRKPAPAPSPPPVEERSGLAAWWADIQSPRRPHYTSLAIGFHWIVAALIVFQLWWGWRMSRLPAGYDKLEAYELHGQVGLTILILTLLRLGWRFVVPRPESTEDMPGWQHIAAELTHWGLYFLLVGLPLTGWMMLSGDPSEPTLVLYGVAPWPNFPVLSELPILKRTQWEVRAELDHDVMVWSLVGLLLMHVGAALKHHFVDKDQVLHRMLPIVRPLSARDPMKE